MHNAYIKKKKCNMIMIMWGLTCPAHDAARWNVEVDSNINTNPSIHCRGLETTCSCVTQQTFCLWFALTRSPDCWAGPCWAAMRRTSQCTGPGWSRWSGLDSPIQPRSPEACGTDTLRVDERGSESFSIYLALKEENTNQQPSRKTVKCDQETIITKPFSLGA